MTPIIRQRVDRDCGCAALAMLAQISYEDAYIEIARVDPRRRGKGGLYNREIIRAAAYLKIRLVATRCYDLDDDEGVLRVRFSGLRHQRSPGGHFTTVRDGQIICPADGLSMPWRDYFGCFDARGCTLLKRLDDDRKRVAA
jgi:hypothetical protein